MAESSLHRADLKTLFQRFKRRPRSGNYLPELDGLRFIAILLVVLFHSYVYFYPKPYPNNYAEIEGAQWVSYFMAQGWFGVQVFFIISGFIITLPFAAHWIHGSRKPNIKNYLSRRFIRIEIPYFIALLLGFLVLPHISSHSYQDLLPRLGASSIYAHSLIYSGELNPLLPPAWTLEIEIQFYLLAPLLALLFRIPQPTLRRATLLTLALLSGFLPRLYSGSPAAWLDHTLAAHLPYFLLGMLMTELHLTAESPNKRYYDFIAIPLWLILPILLHNQAASVLIPILLAVTMWISMHGRVLRHFLSRPWIAALGGMCYSIYLFHGAILELVKKHIVDQFIESKIEHSLYNLMPLALTTSLVFLSAPPLYLCFEKPFMPKPRQK